MTLLVRDAAQADELNAHHCNSRYLPGLRLHNAVRAVADAGFRFPPDSPARTLLAAADLLILAVPCQFIRDVLGRCIAWLSPSCVLVNAAKGIEISSLKTVESIVGDLSPAHLPCYAAISGPSFAREAMLGKPTAVVLGCRSATLGAELRNAFSSQWFRTYSSTDVTGVELGGAVKNVIAIAAGLSDGLEFGLNARAALLTRGLAEIRRLGVKLGARPETFMGLSGIGDLMLTCSGELSRNRQTGLRLGAGESLNDILASSRSVSEGVPTTQAVCLLAAQNNIEMPICETINAVLYKGMNPREAVRGLMSRRLKDED